MKSSTIIAVAIFFLLVIGGVFAWNSLNAPETETNQIATEEGSQGGVGGGPGMDLNQTTVDESSELNRLFQEHAINAGFHLQDLYDGKDTSGTAGKLQDNAIKTADFFQSKLGVDRNEFLSHWDAHIRDYENYTNALKNNNENGKAEARSNLNDHAMMMGESLNRVHPNISAEEVSGLMNEHIDLTLAVIEAHAAGNTAEKLTRSTEASTQAVKFADRIVDTIEGDTD